MPRVPRVDALGSVGSARTRRIRAMLESLEAATPPGTPAPSAASVRRARDRMSITQPVEADPSLAARGYVAETNPLLAAARQYGDDVPVAQSQINALLERVRTHPDGIASLSPYEITLLRTPAEAIVNDVPAARASGEAAQSLQFVPVTEPRRRGLTQQPDKTLLTDDGVPVKELPDSNGVSYVTADGDILSYDGSVLGTVVAPERQADAALGPNADLESSAISLAADDIVPMRPRAPSSPDDLALLAQRIRQATMDPDVARLESTAGFRQLQKAVDQLSAEDLALLRQQSDLSMYVSPQAPDAKKAEALAMADQRLAQLRQMAAQSARDPGAQVRQRIASGRAANTPLPARQAEGAEDAVARAVAIRQAMQAEMPDGDWDALSRRFNSLSQDERKIVLSSMPEDSYVFMHEMLGDDYSIVPNAMASVLARRELPAGSVVFDDAAAPAAARSASPEFATSRLELTAGRVKQERLRSELAYSDAIEEAAATRDKALTQQLVEERDAALKQFDAILSDRQRLTELARQQYLDEFEQARPTSRTAVADAERASRLASFDALEAPPSPTSMGISDGDAAATRASAALSTLFRDVRDSMLAANPEYASAALRANALTTSRSQPTIRPTGSAIDAGRPDNLPEAALPTPYDEARAIEREKGEQYPASQLPRGLRTYEQREAFLGVPEGTPLPRALSGDDTGRLDSRPRRDRPLETRDEKRIETANQLNADLQAALQSGDPAAIKAAESAIDKAFGNRGADMTPQQAQRRENTYRSRLARLTEQLDEARQARETIAAAERTRGNLDGGPLTEEVLNSDAFIDNTQEIVALQRQLERLQSPVVRRVTKPPAASVPSAKSLDRESTDRTLQQAIKNAAGGAEVRTGLSLDRASTAGGGDGFVDWNPSGDIEELIGDTKFLGKRKRLGGGPQDSRVQRAVEFLWTNRAGQVFDPVKAFGSAEKAAEFLMNRRPDWRQFKGTPTWDSERAQIAAGIGKRFPQQATQYSRPQMLSPKAALQVEYDSRFPTADDGVRPAFDEWADSLPPEEVARITAERNAEYPDMSEERAVTSRPEPAGSVIFDEDPAPASGAADDNLAASAQEVTDSAPPSPDFEEVAEILLRGRYDSLPDPKPPFDEWRKQDVDAGEPAPAAAPTAEDAALDASATPIDEAAPEAAEAVAAKPTRGRGKGGGKKNAGKKDAAQPAAEPAPDAAAEAPAEPAPAVAAEAAPAPAKSGKGKGTGKKNQPQADAGDGGKPPDGADPTKPADGSKPPEGDKPATNTKPEKKPGLLRRRNLLIGGAAGIAGISALSGARRAGEASRLAGENDPFAQAAIAMGGGGNAAAGGLGGGGAGAQGGGAAMSDEEKITQLLNRIGRRVGAPAVYGIPGSYEPLSR